MTLTPQSHGGLPELDNASRHRLALPIFDRFCRFRMHKVSVASLATTVGETGLLEIGNQFANLGRQSITICLSLT
jgi:hypothetical protein